MPITADVQVPSRSRTFSTADAQAVLDLLTGRKAAVNDDGTPQTDEDGAPVYEAVTPARNVGFGEFGTAGAARSAGVTLNRLLADLGSTQKYAVTTFERDGKVVGVMLNKPAKRSQVEADEAAADAEASAEDAPAEDAPTPRRRRRS